MKTRSLKASMPRRYLAVLTLCALLGAGCFACGRSDREELAVDLIDLFGAALVEDDGFAAKYTDLLRYEKLYRNPYGPDSPRLVKAGFDIDKSKMFQNARRSIYLGATDSSPCRITVPLEAKTRGETLGFSLGGLGGIERQCVFSISIIRGDRRREVFKTDKRGIPGRGWREYSISLKGVKLDGASVEMKLLGRSARLSHVFVANPRIFKRGSGSSLPNVVFISVDSLRADAVDSIEKRYGITPAMDSLARDGIACSKHFVVSNWTRPSTICMLSGVLASHTGVNIFYPPVSDEEKECFYRRSGTRLITSILKDKGYITRSIGNNAFIIEYTGIGVDLNFDEVSEYQSPVEDTVDITAEAVEWLERNASRRFFLFVNYNAPHNAYIPPPEYLGPLRKKFPSMHPWFRAYLGEVAYTDDYLGRLVNALKRLKLYENTIIVLAADHGEIFSPDKETRPYTDVRARFSHGQTQYDEELRVPLIIKPRAGSRYRGARVDTQVRNMDIAPTILDLIGLDGESAFKGSSILPILDGKERGERPVYSEGRMMYSVRAGGFKYAERFYGFGIRPFHWGGDVVKEYAELYDLKADPNEQRNVLYERPDDVRRMKKLLYKERFKQPDRFIEAGGKQMSGRLWVEEGFFYDVEALPSSAGSALVRKAGRKALDFSLPPGGRIRFQTIPAEANLSLSVHGGGRLLAGRYLLPAFAHNGGAYRIKGDVGLARGEPAPELKAMAGPGVRYWHDQLEGGLRGVQKEKYLSRDVNRLLERWGYIQGKEKRGE